jgi:hypothetical protein
MLFLFCIHTLVCKDTDLISSRCIPGIGGVSAAGTNIQGFSVNIKRSAEPVLYLFLDPAAETFIKFSTHYQAEFITADAESIVIAADTGLKAFGSFF